MRWSVKGYLFKNMAKACMYWAPPFRGGAPVPIGKRSTLGMTRLTRQECINPRSQSRLTKYHTRNRDDGNWSFAILPGLAKECLGEYMVFCAIESRRSLSFKHRSNLFQTFAYLDLNYRLAHLSRGNREIAANSTSLCLS